MVPILALFLGSLSASQMCVHPPCDVPRDPNLVPQQPGGDKIDIWALAMCPYTGGLGNIMGAMELIMQQAVDEIEANGTLLPNHRLKLQVAPDPKCSTAGAIASTIQGLMSGPTKFAVIGDCCSGSCMGNRDVADVYNVPSFSPFCTSPVLSNPTNYPNLVRYSPMLGGNNEVAFDVMKNVLKYRRIAVLSQDVSISISMADGFLKLLDQDKDHGWQLVMQSKIFDDSTLPVEEQSPTLVAKSLQQSSVRMVWTCLYEDQAVRLFCAMRKLGDFWKNVTMLVGCMWWSPAWHDVTVADVDCTSEEVIEVADGTFGIDRSHFVNADVVHGLSGRRVQEVKAEYQAACAANGGLCHESGAAYAYDAVWSAALTLRLWLDAGHGMSDVSYDNEDLDESLFEISKTLEFQGLTGYIAHDEVGDRMGSFQIRQIQARNPVIQVVAEYSKSQGFNWINPFRWGDLTYNPNVPVADADLDSVRPTDQSLECPPGFGMQELLGTCLECSAGNYEDGGVCVACEPGTAQNVSGATECDVCRPGTVTELRGESQCMPCAAGTFQPEAGQRKCQSCPPDFWRLTSQVATECVLCPHGYHRKATDQGCLPCTATNDGKCECLEGEWVETDGVMECVLCPPGFVRPSVVGQCIPCEPGYANSGTGGSQCQRCDAGFFSNESAAISCTQCPDRKTTADGGSPSSDHCVCGPGFYTVGDSCSSCPDEAVDDRLCMSEDGFAEDCCISLDRNMPRQPPGYYLKQRGTDWDMYRCISKVFCPQSDEPAAVRCANNFDPDSLVCARCVDGYHLVKDQCQRCAEGVSALPFIFTSVMCFLLLIFVYYKLNSPVAEEASPLLETCVTLAMTLTAIQSLSVMAQLNVIWESPASDVMEAMKIFAFDVELLSFDCFWSSDPTTRYYFRLMIPIMAAVGFSTCHAASISLAKVTGGRIKPWILPKTCNSIGQVIQALYIGIALAAMLPFQCYQHPTGESSMRKFPEVICGDSTHDAMFGVGVLATLVYGVGFYVVCLFVAIMAPFYSMQSPLFNQYFRFLLANFRSDTWWWGVVLLSRSFSIALVPIVFPTNGNAQLVMLSTVVSIFLTVQAYNRPWKSVVLNLADTCVCLMLILLAAVSGVFAETEDLRKSPFTVFMFLVLMASGVIIFMVFCRACVGPCQGDSSLIWTVWLGAAGFHSGSP